MHVCQKLTGLKNCQLEEPLEHCVKACENHILLLKSGAEATTREVAAGDAKRVKGLNIWLSKIPLQWDNLGSIIVIWRALHLTNQAS